MATAGNSPRKFAAAHAPIAKRPALALAVAALAVLTPELARGFAGERGGWLLTSHIPIAWRDDSVISYLDAVARGVDDAVWVWSEQAIYAPILWLVATYILLRILISRLRIS